MGDVAVGSEHPIRVQSMTTTFTTDTRATVDQIERLVDAGCEIVRLTVPTSTDADNLPRIREELARRRVRIPLVADIHFTPAAALRAVEHVEKIRINPGNYADKKKFAVREYSDAEYGEELERVARAFSPLVRRAAELGVSMRIGTNHGSLSDRIMNRFGDTPLGMVESALEFVRICEAHDYRELILSMKASNPVVVLEVYRLLAVRMTADGMDYPFHLGVTEAGDGEDGRIKSAIGIGALLDEGIGDTVRVSLTEDPVAEVPVARALVAAVERARPATVSDRPPPAGLPDPARRQATEVRFGPQTAGGTHPVLVDVVLGCSVSDPDAAWDEIEALCGPGTAQEERADVVTVGVERPELLEALESLGSRVRSEAPGVALSARVKADWVTDAAMRSRWLRAADRLHLRLDPSRAAQARGAWDDLLRDADRADRALLVELGSIETAPDEAVDEALAVAERARDLGYGNLMLAVSPSVAGSPLHANRLLAHRLDAQEFDLPIVLIDRPEHRQVDPMLGPAQVLGGLLCEGVGDAIQVTTARSADSRRLAFGILQAARVRITRTEFISCPSCGRTLFDLEETTARIKARTGHLTGLKIAVMGCIVNGPGEMADADFGYVGWGEGRIALFVGREMVARDVPADDAEERLVSLIKQHDRWVDP